MARQLLLVRHASIAPALAGCMIGSTDVPLDAVGLREAAELGEGLAGCGAGRCYCSPLRRAMETAGAVWREGWPAVEVDADLREIGFGEWEGRTFGEIAAADPGAVGRWNEFGEDFAFPGGESIGVFWGRVQRCAARMVADPADVVMAVTHGGVIRAMICQLLGLHPRQYVVFEVRRATCVVIDLFEGGRGVLSGLNLRGVGRRLAREAVKHGGEHARGGEHLGMPSGIPLGMAPGAEGGEEKKDTVCKQTVAPERGSTAETAVAHGEERGGRVHPPYKFEEREGESHG